MKKVLIALLLICNATLASYAQSIVLASGSLDCLKTESILKFTFTFNDMSVGKMTEQEYIDKKVREYNEKESGKGDQWLQSWNNDRTARFEPKFLELFNKVMVEKEINLSSGDKDAKYVFEINTDFTEPGFNVGVMRQNASVDLSCRVIEIATGKQVAFIKIRNSSANNFWGTDFDSGYRIQESYAKAGRELAKFIIKRNKL